MRRNNGAPSALRILLIEDNPADADLIREMSADGRIPCVLITADQLLAGMKLLDGGAFDAVLLDLSLPDSSGIDTLRTLQKQAPALPIIVLTGLADEELATQAIGLGAQDYLVKGQLDGETLARSVRYARERKKTEEELKRRTAELEALLFNAPIGFAFFDREHRYTRINKALAEANGIPAQEHIGHPISDVLPAIARTVDPIIEQVFETRQPISTEMTGMTPKDPGESRHWLVFFYPVIAEGARPYAVGACVIEITERKRMEEEIKHMAHHDALTGLPNRRLFMDILRLEQAKARRSKGKFAVLFLDLDKFKYINDTLGHDTGDALLREAAQRLRRTIRTSDSVARIGGDEFNILLTDIAHTEDVVTIAEKIVAAFKLPCVIGGHELHTSTSIGIGIYPDDGENSEELFRKADIAMYHAKETGGNTYQFYDPAMNVRTVERLRFVSWLRQAINREELEVLYQPQVDLATEKIVCAEALVRWRHSERGVLEPKHFVPLAEEIGFVTKIDDWVLWTACRQFREWQEKGYPASCVTVNLSAKQFKRVDLVEHIARVLAETGLPPHSLTIEITESLAMENLEHIIPTMRRLVEMGISISIDDFGTGYSSLSYLKRLPVNKLKIDQSFVRDIATDFNDRSIIRAVVALAQNMQLSVIAEGVETDEQRVFLRSVGCREIQGNLVSKPLPPEEYKKLIAVRQRETG